MLTLDLCARQRPRDAIEVATAALRSAPDDGDLLMALGRAFFEDGQHDRAQEALITAARTDRLWAEPYVWLSRVLAACGRADKAARFAARAISLGADEPELRTMVRDRKLASRFNRWRADRRTEEPTLLAMGLLDAGWTDEGREVVELELQSDPEDEDLRALAARAGVAVPLIRRSEPPPPPAVKPVAIARVPVARAARPALHDTLVDHSTPWVEKPRRVHTAPVPAPPVSAARHLSDTRSGMLREYLATRRAARPPVVRGDATIRTPAPRFAR